MRVGSKTSIVSAVSLTLLGAVLMIRGVAVAAQTHAPVFVHVAPSQPVTAAGGSSTTIVLKLTIDKGYHLQGNNAKDPYIPTTAAVRAPSGITVGKIAYSPSVKKAFSGETLPVYENLVVIRIPITIGRAVKAGDLKLPVTINYQGCNDKSCFAPTTLTTNVAVKVAAK